MAYDRQLDEKFRRFQNRILELEKAADAHDRALEQLAEKMGVELDLARMPAPEEVSAENQARKSGERLLEDKAVMALLQESEQDDAQ